jgi:hypothetical protein
VRRTSLRSKLRVIAVATLTIAAMGIGVTPAQASGPSTSGDSSAPASTASPTDLQYEVRRVPGWSPELPAPPKGVRWAREVLMVTQRPVSPATSDQLPAGFKSADGCTPALSIYATCIHVKGSGLRVDSWVTNAYYSCGCNPVAYFYANGVGLQVTSVPYQGPGRYVARFLDVPRNFANNTRLCNSWPGDHGGNPCITVHR